MEKNKASYEGLESAGRGVSRYYSGRASVIRRHLNRNMNEMRKKAMALSGARAFQTEVGASVNALR